MSGSHQQVNLENALSNIHKKYRVRLIKAYLDLKASYQKNDFDACGLRAGVFCEVILRFLQDYLTQNSIPFGTKIPNFESECRKLETTQKTSGPESLRIIIPRAINYLYTMRNKRGIGHVGGDVDANGIDAATIARLSDWCICELIRVFHNLSLEDAQAIVNTISTKQLPVIWEVMGKKRILNTGISYPSKTLLLLYNDPNSAILTEDLFNWIEHSNLSVFKRDVLRRLHKAKMVEYDKENEAVIISPLGIERIEKEILPEINGE